jgi:hypothetical protein
MENEANGLLLTSRSPLPASGGQRIPKTKIEKNEHKIDFSKNEPATNGLGI